MRESSHALDCAQRVTTVDWVLVEVAKCVFNQHRRSYVQLHVALVHRHLHIHDVFGVRGKTILICRNVSNSLIALLELFLSLGHDGVGLLGLVVSLSLIIVIVLLVVVVVTLVVIIVALVIVTSVILLF